MKHEIPPDIRIGQKIERIKAGGTSKRTMRFPMPFKEALRRVIGGRSHGDRLAIFRKFWRERIKYSASYNFGYRWDITEDEIEKIIAEKIEEHTRSPLPQKQFNHYAFSISVWRFHEGKKQRTEAVNARWQKQKARKAIDSKRKRKK